MKLTKMQLLRMLDEAGGKTTEYPFIEIGKEYLLNDLVRDGFVVRIARVGDLDEIRITDKGRSFLKSEEEKSPSVKPESSA